MEVASALILLALFAIMYLLFGHGSSVAHHNFNVVSFRIEASLLPFSGISEYLAFSWQCYINCRLLQLVVLGGILYQYSRAASLFSSSSYYWSVVILYLGCLFSLIFYPNFDCLFWVSSNI